MEWKILRTRMSTKMMQFPKQLSIQDKFNFKALLCVINTTKLFSPGLCASRTFCASPHMVKIHQLLLILLLFDLLNQSVSVELPSLLFPTDQIKEE